MCPRRRPVVTVTCTRTPQINYVTSDSDGLVPSDGSHMGSVSVIDSDSITDPLADGFVDQPPQVGGT